MQHSDTECCTQSALIKNNMKSMLFTRSPHTEKQSNLSVNFIQLGRCVRGGEAKDEHVRPLALRCTHAREDAELSTMVLIHTIRCRPSEPPTLPMGRFPQPARAGKRRSPAFDMSKLLNLNPRAQGNEEVRVYNVINVYNDFLTFLDEVRVYNVYVTKMTESERLASGAAGGN